MLLRVGEAVRRPTNLTSLHLMIDYSAANSGWWMKILETTKLLLTTCISSLNDSDIINNKILHITRTMNLAATSYAPFMFSFFSAKHRSRTNPETLNLVRQVISQCLDFACLTCTLFPEHSGPLRYENSHFNSNTGSNGTVNKHIYVSRIHPIGTKGCYHGPGGEDHVGFVAVCR